MTIRKSSTSGVPFGNTANRPASPAIGQTYYNGELGYQEIYTTAGWIPSSGGNDFNLNITGTYTTVTFSQSYGAGSYSIVSGNNDATIDIYAFAGDGTLAGYTSTKSFTATQRFNKMVVLGGTSGDVLGFSFKQTYTTSATTSETTAGPFITAISPSFMANVNDTVTITGGNFANDVQVAFTGTGYTSTPAKNIVRSSASSLIVTRPDNFPISASPFTVTVTNPGVNAPVSTNAHISSNSITAGVGPVWNTGATLPTFTRNVAYSTLLSASDADSGGSITYSFVSGSLPTGITFTALTGAVSGTPTTSLQTTFTIRATDAGGNFVDRTFTLPNAVPTWSTGTTLPTFTRNSAYSTTVVATDDSGNTPTYSIVSGSLPTGLSLDSSTGAITGTPTSSTTATFTIRATDANGGTVDRAFTMPNVGPTWVTAAGALTQATTGAAYSVQLSATDDSGTAPSYSLFSGSLPTGLSLSSSGLISGTTTSGNGNAPFIVRATDANGNTADRTFNISTVVTLLITSNTTWTVPSGVTSIDYILVAGGGGGGAGASNVGGSGGGAGGVIVTNGLSVTPGNNMPIVIGAGATFVQSIGDNGYGSQGSSSTFAGQTAIGGGGGGAYNVSGSSANGGSGGGGWGSSGSSRGFGTSGQGNNGGLRYTQYDAAGGGGKNSAGGNGATDNFGGAGAGGSAYQWVNGEFFGGGGGARGSSQGTGSSQTSSGGTNAGNGGGGSGVANRGGGGGGNCGGTPGSGGSGCVGIRYLG